MLYEISSKTGVGIDELKRMTWNEVVDNVILPKMAGPRPTRWCIHDDFMNLMANHHRVMYQKNEYLTAIMLEIALQRLSCGAVSHPSNPTTWPEPLPTAYWAYSSRWDECHVMTQGCYNFICSAMEQCLRIEMTRNHAMAILLGLMEVISPDGEHNAYYLYKHEFEARCMYNKARELAEKYGEYDELFKSYAKPKQWEKHIDWFSQNYERINWKQFFAGTQCLTGNWFRRWRQESAIKRRIKLATMPVAS